ncbi:hypothetical protein L1787_16665 [Acuticoccus sp. M5D2P5]|uniref:hypothetical protein n=1 Tax=Acuticoccus kalidii TaxID=2910977 RepID=UPI001F3DDDB3|nr:hypothetical protein [Acuticoccus kalidii]MCF3935038.1 hypothetical protein [Acuticoccus kalidii]
MNQITEDGFVSFELGQQIVRERQVRTGCVPPLNEDEKRQAREGPRAVRLLDCVRAAREAADE